MSKELAFKLVEVRRAGELRKAGEEAKEALIEAPERRSKAEKAQEDILRILKPKTKDEAIEEISRLADEFNICVVVATDRVAMEISLDIMTIGLRVLQKRGDPFEPPLKN